MRLIHWISKTKDKKTGPVVASYSPKSTCPDSCSLKEGGCYAWGLFYLTKISNNMEAGKSKFTPLIEALKKRDKSARIVRHRIAGDIVGDVEGTLEECEIVEKEGLINIGYTHNWKSPESQPMKKYFRASCESLEEVLEAREMGWSATLIVPKGLPKKIELSNGEIAYRCPARFGVEGKEDITCNTCTLCKVSDRTSAKTVMFEAHGNNATLKKLKVVLENKQGVLKKEDF